MRYGLAICQMGTAVNKMGTNLPFFEEGMMKQWLGLWHNYVVAAPEPLGGLQELGSQSFSGMAWDISFQWWGCQLGVGNLE